MDNTTANNNSNKSTNEPKNYYLEQTVRRVLEMPQEVQKLLDDKHPDTINAWLDQYGDKIKADFAERELQAIQLTPGELAMAQRMGIDPEKVRQQKIRDAQRGRAGRP